LYSLSAVKRQTSENLLFLNIVLVATFINLIGLVMLIFSILDENIWFGGFIMSKQLLTTPFLI